MISIRLPDCPPFFWNPGRGDQPLGIERLDDVAIGHDSGSFLVDRGVIVAVDPMDGSRERFASSSLRQFAETLDDFAGWYRSELSDDEAVHLAGQFRDRLARNDPAAFRDKEWDRCRECVSGVVRSGPRREVVVREGSLQ